MMMMKNNNPWNEILPSSKKRCISGPDIFWHVDDNGVFCLRFENVSLGSVDFSNIELNEISISVFETDKGVFNITLKLLVPANHELFYFLSSDLINHLANEIPISAQKLKRRLLKWIDLWKRKRSHELSLIAQMNLYSELFVLFEYITPIKGLEFAILSWRGPEKDKQDFDLSDYLIEVKSFLSTSKKILKISSAEQLTIRNQPIKLVALQLSQNHQNGQSIQDLLTSNSNLLESLPTELLGLFYSKLYELGFFEPQDATNKFDVVSTSCYKVVDDFPVINSTTISDGIETVEYSIKIDFIGRFAFNINELIT
jgi:hypothetical protein